MQRHASRKKSGVCTYCGRVHKKGKRWAGTPQGSCRGHAVRGGAAAKNDKKPAPRKLRRRHAYPKEAT